MASLRWIETLFDCTPGVRFFMKDRAGRFTGANRAFIDLLRAGERAALLGKTDMDFFPRHLAREYQSDDQVVMQTRKPLLRKLEVVPQDDLTLDWHAVNKIPITAADGTVVGLAGILLHVSTEFRAHLADESLAPVLEHIASHYGERIRVRDLARLGGLSERTLERRFQESFQTGPLRYLKQVRINAACHALAHTNRRIADIAIDCGFCDQSHLTADFSEVVGETPRRYRQRYIRSSL